MRKDISAWDLYYVTQELQELVSGKIDKIFHPAEKELLLQVHIPNSGKKMLYFTGNFVYFTKNKPEADKPSGFCSFLRKRLENARIKEVKQIGFERILEIVFSLKEGEMSLVFEFISPKNILLTENGEILSAVEYRQYSGRKIAVKEQYKSPEAKIDLFNITLDKVEEILEKSDRESIVKSCAMDFGLGGLYAEEVVLLSNIDKTKKPIEVNAEERERLLKTIVELKNKKIEAKIIYENGKVKEVVPFSMKKFEEFESKSVDSYTEAFRIVLDELRDQIAEAEKTSKYQGKIEKKEIILEEQRKRLVELEEKMEENSKKGDFIYEHYMKVKELIEKAKKGELKDTDKKEKSVVVDII